MAKKTRMTKKQLIKELEKINLEYLNSIVRDDLIGTAMDLWTSSYGKMTRQALQRERI